MPSVEGKIDISGMVGSMLGGAMGGSAGSMGALGGLGALGKIVPQLTIIAGGVTALVASSKMLQSVLGGIGKMFMLIIKPLGDILAVALMPLLYIMKPIGIFFNTIMKPYLVKAMAAMRAGGEMLKAGDTAGAFGAFALGAEYLMKPIFDVVIKGVTEGVAILADIMARIPGIGPAFEGVGDAIRSFGDDVIMLTTNVLDRKLGETLAHAAQYGDVHLSSLLKALDNLGVPTLSLASGFKAAADQLIITNMEAQNWKFADNVKTQLDAASEYAKDLFNEIESIKNRSNNALSQMYSWSSGGGSGGGGGGGGAGYGYNWSELSDIWGAW